MRKTHPKILRLTGVTCLVAVVAGQTVWVLDLLGLPFAWVSVRTAFLLMLAGFLVADAVAYWHIVFISRLPKREKWHWIHVLMLPFQMFAAFQYLIDRDGRS